MNNRSTYLALLALATLAGTQAAQATPIRLDGSEANLQTVVNQLAFDGSSEVNVVTDQYGPDSTWAMNSVFGYASGMIVVELAGYAGSNRFGLYDINNASNRLELFNGAASAGAGVQFSIDSAGNVYRNAVSTGATFSSDLFGFYLETPAGLWYSQSERNADAADHLVAYQGEGELIRSPSGHTGYWGPDTFLLGWEDLRSTNWDQDYNDFVVLVGGVQGVSVPEPATMGLLGLGMLGIGFARRRRVAAA
jgi:hypothetical protein